MPCLDLRLFLTLSLGLLASCLVTGCHDSSSAGPNSVVATANPAGEISVRAGESQTIRVRFDTSDGDPASELVVGGLDALPEGWSSLTSEFGCDELATGIICELTLSFEPQGADSGTLSLDYDYRDREGTAKNGTVTIPYSATSNNNVVATTTPSGEFAVPLDGQGSITVTFTPDDAASASELTVTTDLGSLPAGWSSTPSSFECAAVAADDACQLSLTYAPTSSASGTLSLDFSYTNNSGTEKAGSIDIPYVTVGAKLYAAQFGELHYCAIRGDGTLSDCKPTGGIATSTGIALHGDFAYIADIGQNEVFVCNVGADGSLSNCAHTASGNFFGPFVVATQGNHFYATSQYGFNYLKHCTIESDGSLTSCFEADLNFEFIEGIAFLNGRVYLSLPHSNLVFVCDQLNNGSLVNCAQTGSGFDGPEGIAIADGRIYVSNTGTGNVSTCDINSNTGALASCFTSAVDYGPMGIAIHEGRAYVSTRNGLIYVCEIGSTGALTNCAVSNGGATFGLMVQLGVQ